MTLAISMSNNIFFLQIIISKRRYFHLRKVLIMTIGIILTISRRDTLRPLLGI